VKLFIDWFGKVSYQTDLPQRFGQIFIGIANRLDVEFPHKYIHNVFAKKRQQLYRTVVVEKLTIIQSLF